jgi:hypothetical protein
MKVNTKCRHAEIGPFEKGVIWETRANPFHYEMVPLEKGLAFEGEQITFSMLISARVLSA